VNAGPVVVAVAGDGNGEALDWAAAEASARQCRLHVVHVERLRWAVDISGLVPVADLIAYRLVAEQILRTAADRARSVAADLEISGQALFGATVPALVSQGVGAQLLVLGRRRGASARPRGWPLAAVGGRVAGRAPCPVAIVGSLSSAPDAGSPPRVVVGVDASGACPAALEVAFRAAAQRGLSVTALHAWTPGVPPGNRPLGRSDDARERRAGLRLERALEPWRTRFTDVRVQTRVSVAEPAAALIRESRGAALVVIGSPRHRWAGASRAASVSRVVAQEARCPVVVVHPGEATQRRPAGRRAEEPSGTP
jgi:nucleotide-binding universal stress UspA family protein